ncbi:hypothetical protein ACWEWI_31535 [Streptomyces sp. NPDC003753]
MMIRSLCSVAGEKGTQRAVTSTGGRWCGLADTEDALGRAVADHVCRPSGNGRDPLEGDPQPRDPSVSGWVIARQQTFVHADRARDPPERLASGSPMPFESGQCRPILVSAVGAGEPGMDPLF